jgi:hypothetical protein
LHKAKESKRQTQHERFEVLPQPAKKSKRIYVVIIVAVFIIAALSFTAYSLTAPGPTGPGPIKIEIMSDKPVYLQGEQAHFSIYINNTQNWRIPKPTTISFQIENYSSKTVCIDYVNPPPTFPAHSREFFYDYNWNQQTGGSNSKQVEPGYYTLTVTLEGSVNYGAPAKYTFEIKPNV